MADQSKKSTKRQESFENAILLLAGLGVVAYLKADPQLYFAFVLGVGGKQWGFMWGKDKEYKRDTEVAKAQKVD